MSSSLDIKPIETRYAGCRFRSRLEARWAVFFDTLGIPWEYEPQGYVVGEDERPYLPDFWLPEQHLWVEVKGHLEHDELQTLVAAARINGLPSNLSGQPINIKDLCQQRLLLLGSIPDPKPGWTPAHTLIYLIGTEVVSFDAFFGHGERWSVVPFSEPNHVGSFSTALDDPIIASSRQDLLKSFAIQLVASNPKLIDAYWSARSARFEHGETGRPAAAA